MQPYTQIESPAFVLEEAKLIRNLELIAQVQHQAGVHIILALKAFSMWREFPLVGSYLHGATASSLHEARLIHEEMGVKAHTYSPAYLPEEFDAILTHSSHLTCNSLSELARYGERAHAAGVSVGLRVNPEYSEVETDLYNPASPHGRLGETAPNVHQLPAWVEGLHCHTLCESSAAATARLLAVVEEKFGHFLPQLKWINFGGGHLMTRADYDLPTLVAALQDFRSRWPHLQVILEPGSAIAWQTGVLVSRVLDVIHNHGVATAILDVSFTAHMPDTLEMPYRPQVWALDAHGQLNPGSAQPNPSHPTYRLGGVSCLAGDFLTEYSFERELQAGDRLILDDMIHYTMVKTTTFNGVKHPSISILHPDGRLELVREFGYHDFRSRLS